MTPLAPKKALIERALKGEFTLHLVTRPVRPGPRR